MVGNQDKEVDHKHASQGNAGRLAGLKVQHDLGSLSSPLVSLEAF